MGVGFWVLSVGTDNCACRTGRRAFSAEGAASAEPRLEAWESMMSKNILEPCKGDLSPVNWKRQLLTFDFNSGAHDWKEGSAGFGQRHFDVRVIKLDVKHRYFAVETLSGYTLTGWRYWTVVELPRNKRNIKEGNNTVIIKTGTITSPTFGQDQFKYILVLQ